MINLFGSKNREIEFKDKVLLRDDPKFANNKILIFQNVAVAVFLFLIAGFWRLQVLEVAAYREAADKNRIKSIPIRAPRGKILDRDGRVIVDSRTSFSATLSRSTFNEAHLPAIAEGLHMDMEELESRLSRFRKQASYKTVEIKEGLTPGEIEFVESHNDPETFPELELIQSYRRLYPQHGLAAHVIGYTGEVSEAELSNPDFAQFNQGDIVGKAGIERYYNDLMMGQDGGRSFIVDYRGQIKQTLSHTQAVPGKTIQLAIDLDVQVAAEIALGGRRGSVVALDPRTGEVLAMVSSPSFDLTKFAGRISKADWNEIINNPDNPLLNRSIQAQLAPGSTFKPIVAMAALEAGVIDDNTTFHCQGGQMFYGYYRHCHAKAGHGAVNLRTALAQSCDVYFYNVGDRLGIDRLAETGTTAGLGQKTEIDLPSEKAGIMPSQAWKTRNNRTKWSAGETISLAIGQGQLTVTPLQLASSIGGLAMGAVWHRPHLLKDQPDLPAARKAQWSPANILSVVGGMYAVVNEGGTAYAAKLPGIELCGKTGTAQLVSNAFLEKHATKIKDNAWFVGFAPRQNPEIVVAALFEGGEHGPAASVIARNVVKAYFDKKARVRRPAQIARLPFTIRPGEN